MISVRRAVILVAQILALLSIVVSTMAGALAGEDWIANSFPVLSSAMAMLPGARGISIVGALGGFFISTMLTALFFLLVEITNNTKNPFNT